MTKDEIMDIATSYQKLYDYVEKFMTTRYRKLYPHYWDAVALFDDMKIDLDDKTIWIGFNTGWGGCPDGEVVIIQIDYLTMTDEEILADLATRKNNNK